jgi:hypothetical protein
VVTIKNDVFWGVAPCGSCENQRFGGTYRLHHQVEKNQRARNSVSSNTHLKQVKLTPVFIRAKLRHIPEDGILHSYRRENFKTYIALTGSIL